MEAASGDNDIIDLDDSSISSERLELPSPEYGKEAPREMVILFIQLLLRQAITDKAVAFNLFYDAEDDCLRGVQYVAERGGSDKIAPHEFYPAPGYFAEQVLDELRCRVGIDRLPGDGILKYYHHGVGHHAYVLAPNDAEIRLYLTKERPLMRTKQ